MNSDPQLSFAFGDEGTLKNIHMNMDRVRSIEDILQFFLWRSTEEGWEFWNEVHGKLIRIAIEYEEDYGEFLASIESIRYNVKNQGLGGVLSGAFVWDETPEGHYYWSMINSKLKGVDASLNFPENIS